jgi:hypothetical protein
MYNRKAEPNGSAQPLPFGLVAVTFRKGLGPWNSEKRTGYGHEKANADQGEVLNEIRSLSGEPDLSNDC